MMNTALNTFLSSISTLKTYLDNIERKNDILDKTYGLPCTGKDIKDGILDLQSKRNPEKQFDYSVAIISLYGQYETFVEQIIKEYLKELKQENFSFGQLPQKLQECYFAKSIKLYPKLEWEKYNHLNTKIISKSLDDALNKDAVNLLPEAFYTNAGNYKIGVLADCMTDLGVENLKQTVCKYPPLQSYFIRKHGAGFNVDGKSDDFLFGLLDEVVDTRNKIGHTGKVDEIKDKTYVDDMNTYFECFGKSLNMLLQDTIFQLKWNSSAVPSFAPSNVFNNIDVVGFSGVKMEIHLGQSYLCKNPAGFYPVYVQSKVLGIQARNVDFINYYLREDNPYGVGMKVNHHSSPGCSFKFLR